MSRMLVEADVTTRTKSRLHFGPDDSMAVESAQDVSEIVKRNKHDYNERDGEGFGGGQMMHHIARIPLAIVDDLMRRGIWQNPERMKKWLNDPDNKAWRTKPGRI